MHRQFLNVHFDLVIKDEVLVPDDGQRIYRLLSEEDETLYSMIRRHLPCGCFGDEKPTEIIECLANTFHWRADKHNVLEQERGMGSCTSQSRCSDLGSEETEIYVYEQLGSAMLLQMLNTSCLNCCIRCHEKFQQDAFACSEPVRAGHASYWMWPCLCITSQCGPCLHRIESGRTFLSLCSAKKSGVVTTVSFVYACSC